MIRMIVVGLALLALGFYAGVQYTQKTQSAPEAAVASVEDAYKRVRVAPARLGTRNQLLRFPGVTRSVERASLTFLVSGNLGKVHVDIGDSVQAGQLLATLHNPQLGPQMNAAQARLNEVATRLSQLRKDRERVRYLFETGAATKDELEQLESAYQAMQASKATAQAQLAEATQLQNESEIRASFAGTVDRIYFEPGEFVPPGQPAMELNGGNGLEVEIQVPEGLVGQLAVQQSVLVRFPFLQDREIEGTITELGYAARQVGQLFPVVVAIPASPGLRAGMTAELMFSVQSEKGLQVPVQSVVDPGSGNARLFKLVDDQVVVVPIKVISVAGASVVVQGDLQAGDKIVTAGQRALIGGETVKVLP